MRALLITDWMAGSGGAEEYVSWVRDGLRAQGDQVKLLTSTAGTAADGSADYRAYGSHSRAAQALLQIANPFAAARVRTALHAFRPDVVVVNMFEHHLSPAIFAPLRAVPTVLTVTDYKCICPIGSKLLPDGRLCTVEYGWVCCERGCLGLGHWLRDQPRYALIRAAVRQTACVLSCSRWVQQQLAMNRIASRYLPLPIAPPGRDFRRSPSPEPLFVYCGRLDHEKGVALLLRAFARLRSTVAARLRIVGRGPQRRALESEIAALGLKGAVSLRGWVPPAEVEHELVDAWALVAPSLWAEPLGFVALEAIVRGVPVIASAAGGFGETVEPGVSGLLFPNGDEEGLYQHLRALALGEAFPSHQVPAEVVRRVQTAHRIERYVGELRLILQEVIDIRQAAP